MEDFKAAIKATIEAAVTEGNADVLDEIARELGRLQAKVQMARQEIIETLTPDHE